LADAAANRQAVTVLHQGMPDVAKLGWLPIPPSCKAGLPDRLCSGASRSNASPCGRSARRCGLDPGHRRSRPSGGSS
jgi:hypothetical protein